MTQQAVFIGEANLRVRQRAVGCRLHDGQQVAFQQRQHHLRLRVAEAAVVFNDLGAVRGEHQAEVKAALKGAALGCSWRAMVGRKISSMHRSAIAGV